VPRGHSVGTLRTSAFETAVDVDTRQDNVGVYVTDTLDLTRWLAVTAAGRYQHVSITIRDRSGTTPALDGDHRFDRFSPTAGLTLKALERLTLFGSYSCGLVSTTPLTPTTRRRAR
jgi:iron complex outermembrane recepter protein